MNGNDINDWKENRILNNENICVIMKIIYINNISMKMSKIIEKLII